MGSIAQWYGMKYVAALYKLELAQFIELQSFSQFAANLGQESKNRLTRQVGILSLANQNLLKALAVKDVHLFLNLYLDIPAWTLLLIPPRLLGKSIVCCVF